ncbi:MAG: cytochrome c [Alphaproteobacteria bacterium]|nr:cytochrome c [Alphaproteobacteria bacterium]
MNRSLLVLALLAVGCGDKDADDSAATDDSSATTDDSAADDTGTLEMDGAVLYADHCETCHGPSGGGTASGPNIRPELGRHDDAFIVDVILNGHGDMEPVDVTAEQAQAIVDWMRANF